MKLFITIILLFSFNANAEQKAKLSKGRFDLCSESKTKNGEKYILGQAFIFEFPENGENQIYDHTAKYSLPLTFTYVFPKPLKTKIKVSCFYKICRNGKCGVDEGNYEESSFEEMLEIKKIPSKCIVTTDDKDATVIKSVECDV